LADDLALDPGRFTGKCETLDADHLRGQFVGDAQHGKTRSEDEVKFMTSAARVPQGFGSSVRPRAPAVGEGELVNLALAVVATNGWNRFLIGFRVPPFLGKAPSTAATG
jgi:hypothetical protein